MSNSEGKDSSPSKSEASVLSEASLGALAKEIVRSPFSPIVFLMYLNIPTTTIVRKSMEVSDVGLKNADSTTLTEFTKKLLFYWKSMRTSAKDKDKVNDVERALKEMGNTEIADIFRDRQTANAELTAEDFPH